MKEVFTGKLLWNILDNILEFTYGFTVSWKGG
jgi:hypothetical protein